MDAAALPATPPPQAGFDVRCGNAPTRADDDFSQHLADQTNERAPARRVEEKSGARDKDIKDDDDDKEQAPPPAYALSTPLAPVIVRTDGAQPTQTLSLQGVVGAAAADANAAAAGAVGNGAQDAGQNVATDATSAAKGVDGRKDAKAQKGSAATRADASSDKAGAMLAALNKGDKGADAAPHAPQADVGGLKSAASVAPKAGAKTAELAPPPPALPEVSAGAGAGDLRRTTEAQQSTVHRPPTIAATVAQNVVRRFNGESTSIELRLDPAELGKVHVKLDVGSDSRVTAIVAADNPATLSDLMRSSRELESALESAGLELASGGLSFDLSQNSQDARSGANESSPRDTQMRPIEAANDTTAAPTAGTRPFGLETWRGVRVDMTV